MATTHTLDMAPPRLSFSKINPKLQVAWDSVSIGALKKCPRYYQYKIVEGWQSKTASHHLRYGQLYHRALEVYDHKRSEGLSHEDSMRAALWDLRDGCTDEIADGGVNEDGTACTTRRVWWNPHEHLSEEKAKLDTKTVANLFRTVVWYLDQFGMKDPCRTVQLANGKPAVEVSFRYELGFQLSTGEEVLHSGHFDRLVDLSDMVYVLDRKTTKNTISGNSAWGYFSKFSPDNQMTGYTLAGKVVLQKPVSGVIIDAAQIAKGFSRFERGFTMRTDAQLAEWRNDTLYWISQADRFAQADYWPMNDMACDMYGGCEFRKICAHDPSVRAMYLKSDFIQQPWDPLAVRGDI